MWDSTIGNLGRGRADELEGVDGDQRECRVLTLEITEPIADSAFDRGASRSKIQLFGNVVRDGVQALLDSEFFGIDVTVTFFVFVAGAKEISALGIVEAEDFQVVESPIKCNDNVTDLCGVLLADHHVIAGMNTRIDHRLALCDQCKEFALSNQGFGHANVFDDLLGFFLSFTTGYVAKHGHGVSDLLHLHAAGADGTATVVFQFAVLFHSRKITVNAGNGNPCSGCNVAHRGRFTVASVDSFKK